MKSRLNSDPLSKTTYCGCGYLLIHVLLNNWLTMADDLLIYSPLPPVTSSWSYVSTLMISTPPVAGSIIVMQVRLTVLLIIAPPGWCCLIDLLYGPIRSTCTVSHGFTSEMLLGGRYS